MSIDVSKTGKSANMNTENVYNVAHESKTIY